MSVRVLRTEMRALPMRTRMPFRYGITTLTALPHLFVRVDAEIDLHRRGRRRLSAEVVYQEPGDDHR
jgi:hypothetical protein